MARLLCAGLLLTAFGWAAGPASVLTLTPSSGTVTGLPGAVVGWGYSITNNTSQYMVIVNSYFCGTGQDPLYTTCTQAIGSYSDFIATSATVIPPLSTVTKAFSAPPSAVQPGQGAGSYTVAANAAAGKSDTGSLVVVYDLYSANPFTTLGAVQSGGDIELTATAAVQVPAPATFSVPTLSEWGLMALALLLVGFGTRKLGNEAWG